MAALVRGRYRTCGVALAVAGAMHINFLVLGVGLFTLVALARRDVRREVRLVDLAGLLVPQLAVLAWLLPGLLASAGPGHDALRILVHFHAPAITSAAG